MKLNYLVVIILLSVQTMTAQETSPVTNWIAGGSFSFSLQQNAQPISLIPFIGQVHIITSNRDDIRNTYFSFSPYVGKEVSANWIMGLQLQYTINRYRANDVVTDFFGQLDTIDYVQNENAYTIGLFGRYMFNPESKFVFFLQPYANYSFVDEQNFRNDVITSGLDSYAIGVGTSGGILYNISDQWRLTSRIGLFGFSTGKWTDTESDESNTFSSFGASLSLSSLNLGFEYRF